MNRFRDNPGVVTRNGVIVMQLCNHARGECASHDQLFNAAEAHQLQERLDMAIAELSGLRLLNTSAMQLKQGDILWHLGRKVVDEADFVERWGRHGESIETVVRVKLGDDVSELELTPDTRLWVARLGASATPAQPAPSHRGE